LFTMVDDDNDTMLSWEKEQIFLFSFSLLCLFSTFTILYLSIFNSLLFSLPIPLTNIIIAGRRTDWTCMRRTSVPLVLLLFELLTLFFLPLFNTINNFFTCSLYFIVYIYFVGQMLPSQYVLSVCFLWLCRHPAD
jgi:hypothetical protein